jgi:MAP/microtubule affinity-regulating kinase
LLQSLKHPSIVKVLGTFDAPFKFYIMMDLVSGGSLRQLLAEQPSPGLGEVMSRDLFEQICDGVNYCHGRNVVHRDLKLENILMNPETGCAKLIDFGFALQLKSADQRLRVFCGTPSYMAPELVMGKEYSGFCTDMWALGVVLYGMLVGHVPFQGQTESQLYAKIRRGFFRWPDSVSELPRRIVSGILRIDAASRPTAVQVLQHRWVRPECANASDAPKWAHPTAREVGARPSSVPPGVRRARTVHT